MSPLPADYLERVYAGVLGKIVGVYLGRPVENWSFEAITDRFAFIDRYVNQEMDVPLVVTDDDIAGTFTFLRALEDYDYSPDLTPRQIGQSWLNYIIEGRTILWWGGLFHSSEHTAYLNLKEGIPAPRSGSLAQNGPVIANQIGAQIYIDGWALLHPGDPEKAADFAARAASVSHDDEAVNAARVIAAMEAQAFIESNIPRLIAAGLAQIPHASQIYRMVNDICEWTARDGDWQKTRERIVQEYGYKKYVGGCHVIPNHALIHLGLLYGEGDFRRSLGICVTSGWDTDCNAGNLGCLLAVRGGLAALDQGEVDWRGPVADRLFIPAADGGRCISDAAREALAVVNSARQMRGLESLRPKGGLRYHFEVPGSLQGFRPESPGAVRVENSAGSSRLGSRSLQITRLGEAPARVASATFLQPKDLQMNGYTLCASPTLYPGQVIQAYLSSSSQNTAPLTVRLYLGCYDADDRPARLHGEAVGLAPGAQAALTWPVPEIEGIFYEVGVEIMGSPGGETIFLDGLGWTGTPRVTFTRPAGSSLPFPGPLIFRRAWVDGVDHWEPRFQQAFRIIQDRGRGLIITGTRDWTDYQVQARVTAAKFRAGGIAARVQGMARFYALELADGGKARLLKCLDGEQVLAQKPFDWQIWQPYDLCLAVENTPQGVRLQGRVDGILLLEAVDSNRPLTGGGVALTVERGHLAAPAVRVEPIHP